MTATPNSTTPNTTPAQPGGQPGNQNRTRHGLKSRHGSADHRLSLGGMPKGCERQERTRNQYRAAGEGAVVEAKGAISLIDAHHLNTAATCQGAILYLQKQLRDHHDELAPMERCGIAEKLTRLAAARDTAIGKLGIVAPAGRDPWAQFEDAPEDSANTATSDTTAAQKRIAGPEAVEITPEQPEAQQCATSDAEKREGGQS